MKYIIPYCINLFNKARLFQFNIFCKMYLDRKGEDYENK